MVEDSFFSVQNELKLRTHAESVAIVVAISLETLAKHMSFVKINKFIFANEVETKMMITPLDDLTYCAHSIYLHSFEALVTAVLLFCTVLFMTSLHIKPMCFQMCSMGSVVDLQPFGYNFKGGLFTLPAWGLAPR